MKKVDFVIKIAVMFILVCGISVYSLYYSAYHINPIDSEVLNKIDFDKADNLMIVAHPDDETLWGGGHLAEGNYLVVCITNGKNSIRSKEFENAMNISDDQFIILNYPDKVFGKRDDWTHVEDNINNDLEKIIEQKDWKLIVTHNPQGEYGHQHHIMTSQIVTGIYDNVKPDCDLYYFGKYYSAKSIKSVVNSFTPFDQEFLSIKDKMLKEYSSQSSVVDKFAHIIDYENWTVR